MIAGLRLASKTKSVQKLSVQALAKISGYSRATFFRRYGKFYDFAIKAYHQTCFASVLVYEKRLVECRFARSQFVDFTGSFFYGANVCIPNEIVADFWQSAEWSHREFHPHLVQVAAVMAKYLRSNPSTASISFTDEEILEVVFALDMDILMSRLDRRSDFPSERQYKRVQAFLEGFLLMHDQSAN